MGWMEKEDTGYRDRVELVCHHGWNRSQGPPMVQEATVPM